MKKIEFKVSKKHTSADVINILYLFGGSALSGSFKHTNGLWGIPVADEFDTQLVFMKSHYAELRFFDNDTEAGRRERIVRAMIDLYEALYVDGEK
jgi:hypothetical protein